MTDFFEIDFLPVGTSKSGDAITARYEIAGVQNIHVINGGYQETGETVVEHINKYYENPSKIDNVVVSHPDGGHAGGTRSVLEEYDVEILWMNRTWVHTADLIDRFARFTSVENLQKRLKEIYPSIATLEEVVQEKGIEIRDAFQGDQIGAFSVLSPSWERYLDLVIESEKTPEAAKTATATDAAYGLLETLAKKAIEFVKALWSDEKFSDQETSSENEMSVVQYANICGNKILLTADAGRTTLSDATDYAPIVGLSLPGVDRIQIPHHGSRRNVSSEILDRWLGTKLPTKPAQGEETSTAIVSAAKDDKSHPRKAVIRGFIHRGAAIKMTKGTTLRTSQNAPKREGCCGALSAPYPEEQEH